MHYKIALFKIGGKILENFENLNSTISQLTQLYNENLINKIVIIPGGGSFANFIREVYNELKFTEDIAHWMGIISMNYNGLKLKNKFPEFEVFKDLMKLKKINRTLSIFLPYEFLKETNNLPHSWDVTSDSITLYIAGELGLKECFLIKDVDGILDDKNRVIKEILASEFKELKKRKKLAGVKSNIDELKERSTPIDIYTTTLIEKLKISCFILNGSKNMARILNYFTSTNKAEQIFTKIK
ncbi:MAG: hypothetical protein ACFFDH_22535 [Promethearchaeota archaeon]